MAGLELCDVVGPICESSDFLAKDRMLPPMKRGDLLAAARQALGGREEAPRGDVQEDPAVRRPPARLHLGQRDYSVRINEVEV